MKVTSIHASSKTKYSWVLKNWHWHNFQTHCLLVHYAMFLYYSTTKFCGPDLSTLDLYPLIIQKCPPDNKTSWRRSIDISLYVQVMLQVRLKWNTQRRLSGTSPRRLSGTSYTTSYWYVVMTSHGDVMTTFHQYVYTTSQTRLKWNSQWRLSGTSPRRLSGTYPLRAINMSLQRLL